MATRNTTEALGRELERLEHAHLYRRRQVASWSSGLGAAELCVDGRRCLAFCRNDYLGLANDPRLAEALGRHAKEHGTGSGSAHLIAGHRPEHHALEEELAEFTGFPRALLFSTGYMANLGLLGTLAGRGDGIAEDRLNHASLLDASRLSGAQVRRYAHADPDAAARRLAGMTRRRFLVTDGVFSMDGDIAPLAALATVAHAHGADLLVDDAHGLGVLGRTGVGSLEAAGLRPEQVAALVGTLGKAFGTFGAFVAGCDELIEALVQGARSYIYTTAPPPAIAAATRVALRIARAESWRRAKLSALVARFRAGAVALGLRILPSETPIQPVLAGSATAALRAAEALFEAGLLVTAIRPPTVPAGSARLRITFSATHEESDIDRLLDGLATIPALCEEEGQ